MLEVNKIHCADCLEALKQLPDESVEAIVTDPPYEFGFMGKKWDNSGIAYNVDLWKECLRVLKPGGHLLAFGGTRTYHRMAVAIEDSGFEVRDMLEWIYACLDKDTEILTKRGFLSFDEMRSQDMVACFDKDTNTIDYKNPTNIFIYDYDGVMYSIKGRTLDQLLTPNHRILLKEAREKGHRNNDFYETDWMFRQANELTPCRGITLPLAGKYIGNKSIGIYMAELIGWIITEGTYDKRNDGIYICQSNVNKEKVDRIRFLLEETKLFYKEWVSDYEYKGRKSKRHDFYIPKEKAIKIKELLPNKKPTKSLLELNYNELEALFNGLIGGDGSYKQDSNKTLGEFYQKDIGVLDWFQVLCLHLGYKSSRNIKKTCVSFGKKAWAKIDAGWFKKKITQVEYKGKVWCVEVPTSAFVARRNGKIFITGNSGFPKSLNIGKAADKMMGNEREVVGDRKAHNFAGAKGSMMTGHASLAGQTEINITKGTSPYEGQGTALKPAHESILVAQKPLNTIPSFNYLICQLQSFVEIVERSLKLNQAEQKEELNFVQQNAEQKNNILGDLKEVMDILQSELKQANIVLNMLLSWKNILEESLSLLNKSIILTEKEMTIELRTLNYLLSDNILKNIIKEELKVNGNKQPALLVENYLKGVLVKLHTTQELSVQDPAILKENNYDLPHSDKAHEPIILARKLLSEKTIVENVIKHGTGGIEIDGCRIPTSDGTPITQRQYDRTPEHGNQYGNGAERKSNGIITQTEGRFPANIIVTDDALNDGVMTKSPKSYERKSDGFSTGNSGIKTIGEPAGKTSLNFADSGSKSRYFDIDVWAEKHGLLQFPKASKRERILDSYITIKLIKSELHHILWKEENTALVELLKKVMLEWAINNFSIVESGENIMVQFHRDSLSTIKMEINKIIELKTLNLLMHLPINDCIQIVNSEKENGGSYVQFVKNGNQSQKSYGISQEKNGCAITDVENAILESLLKIKEKEGEQSYSTHPTHKPVHLMAWLVRLVSKEGDTVLDPFMGSGTTGIACLKLNRNFIGIEKESEYIKIAEARLGNLRRCKIEGDLNE